MHPSKRQSVVLLASKMGYQTRIFAEAAQKMGLDVTMATDRCHELEDPWGDQAIPLHFDDPAGAAELTANREPRPDAVIATGDQPAYIAALVNDRLRLPGNPPEAVALCRNKFKARQQFQAAGLPVPAFTRFAISKPPKWRSYPCVLKPLGLSASRGVIRANDQREFDEAFLRIRAILQSPDIRRMREEQDEYIQVEEFIPGREFALEGILTGGRLQVLAIFDKPDPLDGPFFEETIYVTPSNEADAIQRQIVEAAAKAVECLGLRFGPVHAEMRVNDEGVWMLEVAARPIGGLCAHALRFDNGMTLEELILRHALGEDVSGIRRETAASGVMMIPIPKNGLYQAASGVKEAAQVAELIITAKEGQRLLRLPEGNSYLGFLFARGDSTAQAVTTLKRAHTFLRFEIATELEVVK